MKNKFLLSFLLISLIFIYAENNSLINPLKDSPYITSSFGEYRANHFHGGIDFSTNGEEGYEVLAVGDGYVRRIRREPYGYGRVLYLDLIDGRTAVCGHLIRFSRNLKIEDALIKVCEERGTSFPGDIYLNPPIKVAKGDVIGYSGGLGAGSPHLHFELRKNDYLLNPIDEGIGNQYISQPFVEKICFLPEEDGTRINNSLSPLIVRTKRLNPNTNFFDQIKTTGKITILIQTYAQTALSKYKTFPKVIRGKINDGEFFYLNMRKISLSHYKESPFLFERIGDDVFVKLKKDERLTIWEIHENPFQLKEGLNSIEIEIDNGKKVYLKGQIFYQKEETDKVFYVKGLYHIEDFSIYPFGILIKARKVSNEQITEIFINNTPVPFYFNELKEETQFLIPKSEIPKSLSKISVNNQQLKGYFFYGKGEVKVNNFLINSSTDCLLNIINMNNSININVSPKSFLTLLSLSFQSDNPSNQAIFSSKGFFNKINDKPMNLSSSTFYKILTDNEPPKIKNVFTRKIDNIQENELVINFSDNLSAVNPYSIKIFIDGKKTYFDFDFDTLSARVDLTKISKGNHILEVEFSDLAGNKGKLLKRNFFL